MSLGCSFKTSQAVKVPTTEPRATTDRLNQKQTPSILNESQLPKLEKIEKLDEIVKSINEMLKYVDEGYEKLDECQEGTDLSADKAKCKTTCLFYKIETLNTSERDYVIRHIDSNRSPLNIDSNHPINEKLKTLKSEIIKRVIEDRKNNPENFENKLLHFFKFAAVNNDEIKENFAKIFDEINKRISTLDENTLIYFENSHKSSNCFPFGGIVRITNHNIDDINLVSTIGHELGHIILCNMIPKENNNRIGQFEELLCDTFGAYALSLFGEKKTNHQPIGFSAEFTEQKNGKGCKVHPDDYTRNRIKDYILKNVDLESAKEEIINIIGDTKEYRFTSEEKKLLNHILNDEYEEARKMLMENPNIKIISTPENTEKIIKFICNHGYFYNEGQPWINNIDGYFCYETGELTLDNMLKDNPQLLNNNVFLAMLIDYLNAFEKRINLTSENKDLFLNATDKVSYGLTSFIELDELLADSVNLNSQYYKLTRCMYLAQAYANKRFEEQNAGLKEHNINPENNSSSDNIDIEKIFPCFDFNYFKPNYIDVTKENVEKCFLLLESFKNSFLYKTLLFLFKDDQKLLVEKIINNI